MNFKRLFIVLIIGVNFILYIVSYLNLTMDYSKNVNNNINTKVWIIGRNVGLKLYTKGILVVGKSEIDGVDGKIHSPSKDSNIQIGDMIKEVNGMKINTAKEFMDFLQQNGEKEITLKYENNYKEYDTKIKPVLAMDNVYMIGLWVRDAAAGIGTMTYYNEENSKFAALGHGIEDIDTGDLLNISNGELVKSNIVSIKKADKNNHGEIRGTIDDNNKLGEILINKETGIYGIINNKEYVDKVKLFEVEVADRSEIKNGEAEIYCELENDKIEKYEIKVLRIFRRSKDDNKSMLIKITDNRLIEKTGGIIPGMSGTPIIQNGKLIGAITNVLVNKPDEGYAIFSDIMCEN